MANTKSIVELILQAKVEGEQTFQQLTDATTKLINQQEQAEKAAGSYDQKLEKLRSTMDGLVRAERDLITKGRLVEKFKQQAAATSQADARAKELIQTARTLRAQLNATSSGDANRAKLSAQFDKASAAAQKAVLYFQKQRTELARLTGQMNQAGLSTANLANAEARLSSEAVRLQAAQNRTADAIGRVQQKTDSAAKSMARFGRDSRTSLSLLQRLRGEVLSLAAAYVGLFGIGREVGNIFEANRKKQAIESRFRVAFDGDPQAVDRELNFLRETADRLKVSFVDLGTEYSQMVAAMPEGLFTLEEVRKLFVDVTTAGRVMRLSQEQLRGVFKAFRDIVSKSTVQMEELKGQLGDRLPGAVLLFAESMKVTTRELVKMVEQGEVGADALKPFAALLEKKYGGDLERALQAATSQLDAFLVEVERLRLEIGEDSGFIETLGQSLRDLSEELRKPETKEGLTNLADLMGDLAKAGVFVVQNLDAIKNAVIAFVGARVLGGLIRGFFQARLAAVALGGSLRTLGFAGLLATGPAGWIVALAAGIGTIALASRNSGSDIDALRKKYKDLGDAAETAGEKASKAFGSKGGQSPIDEIDNELDKKLTEFGLLVAEEDRLRVRTIRFPRLSRLFGTDDDLADTRSALKNIGDVIVDLRRKRDALLAGPDKPAAAAPELLPGLSDKQIEEVEKAIKKANEAIEDFQAVTLAQKLALVDKEFASLLATARSASDLETRNSQEALVLKALAAKKREIVLEAEQALLKEADKLEKNAAKRSEDNLKGRLDNIRAKYADTLSGLRELNTAESRVVADRLEGVLAGELSGEIDKVKKELANTVADLRTRLAFAEGNERQAGLDELGREFEATISRLKGLAGVEIARKLFNVEAAKIELQALEKERQKALDDFQRKLDSITNQESIGALSSGQAIDQADTAQTDLNATLDGLIARSRELLDLYGDNTAVADWFSQFGQQTQQAKEAIKGLADNAKLSAKDINQEFSGGLTNALSGFIQGTVKAKDALREFAADFLRFIGEAVLRVQLLKAVGGASGGGGIGGLLAPLLFGAAHTGGVIGEGFSSYKAVPPVAFVGAPKYHSGGVVGLSPGEVPIIAKKGEEVLTSMDPRHRDNLTKSGKAASPQIRNYVLFDRDQLTREMLSSPAGVETMVTVVGENPQKFGK